MSSILSINEKYNSFFNENDIIIDSLVKKRFVTESESAPRIISSYMGNLSKWYEFDSLIKHKVDPFPYIYKELISKQTRRVVSPLKPKQVVNPELDWFEKNYNTLKKEYTGKWIAVAGNKLVSYGDSFASVYRSAREKGFTRPFITCISPDGWEK